MTNLWSYSLFGMTLLLFLAWSSLCKTWFWFCLWIRAYDPRSFSTSYVCIHTVVHSSFLQQFYTDMWYTPTNQGTSDILGKMRFWCHCRVHTFSFNLTPKSSLYSSYFLRYDHSHISPQAFSLELWYWGIGLWSFLFLYFWIDLLHRMQNFLKENISISVRNYMEVIENILSHVKNENLKIDQRVIFHPYANFNYPYLKICLCNLFLAFTYTVSSTDSPGVDKKN